MNNLFQLILCAVLFCLSGTLCLNAQSHGDSTTVSTDMLTYTKTGGRIDVKQNGKMLDQQQLFLVLNKYEESDRYLRRYKTKNTVAAALGGIGGALVGFPLGLALGGGDPVWGVAIAGAGLIAIAIPIAVTTNKDLLRSIEAYNNNVGTSALRDPGSLHLQLSAGGVGIGWRF